MNTKNKIFFTIFSFLLLLPSILFAAGGQGKTRTGVQSTEEILLTILIFITFISSISIYSIKKSVEAKSQKSAWFALAVLIIGMFAIISLFALVYVKAGLHQDFSTSLYFSLVTWTTLGYGDYSPDEATRFYAAFEALIGYLFMGLFVSLLYRCLTFKDRHC